jgi:hypothetical protein
MSEGYDPQSQNAMFSRIIQRLDQQDRDSVIHRTEVTGILTEIRTETRKTNGRVTVIEQWINTTKAKIALMVLLGSTFVSVAAWVFERVWK